MGAVYEAWDRERGQLVALKTLLHFSPATLYLFKQEFRTLADVSHPNLVRLHELVMTGLDHIFFAMELVGGQDFLAYTQTSGIVADSQRPVPSDDHDVSHTRISEGPASTAESQDPAAVQASTPSRSRRRSPADLSRLRPALCQLVEGVMALHAARKLHRDIKPSNVLVTTEGRVVLLDFGVATEFSRVVDEELREEEQTVGTARYMAPEQAFEEPGPACDWYSVGVMLYEALVGRPPFAGSAVDVLTLKNSLDPLPPSVCVAGVPPDLDALCVALLHREPVMRPNGEEILRRLGTTAAASGRAGSATASAADEGRKYVGLTGRAAHLRALHEAFDRANTGRSVTIGVGGRPGTGKSSLVHRFLDELVERGAAVVLRGRAYEREAVPYKAFDSVIDSLSRYLMRLGEEDLTIALPKDVWALAHIFPVLRRVPSIGGLAEEPIRDPQRVRRRAFFALRELLSTLARRRPIVLFVDDAQWGDVDSAALWLELVRPPHAPPLLLVMTYRDEEAQTSPFLCDLRARWPELAELRDLPVGPLEPSDARRLALALLESGEQSSVLVADAIARESGGNPFLVEELARSVGAEARNMSAQQASAVFASLTLERMVESRLAVLPDAARRLLEIVAVCGRPLASSVATQAAGIQRGMADELIAQLRTGRFLRAGLRNGREVLEAVHARIRETIVAQLGASAVREHHGRIARVLEATPEVDVEALATHLQGAGETDRAAEFAERAAERAAGKLAFEQAARLLQLTLQTYPVGTPDGGRVRKRLGEVLEWAARSAEAGHTYLEAAEGAPPSQKMELQRAAAEQLYASGRIDEGTQILYQVLAAVGQRAALSRFGALFWLVAYHIRLRIVGLRFKERSASEVSPEDRFRIDALYVVTLGFALVDQVLCMSMRARVLVESLRVGDRSQVARAAAMVACDLGGNGRETRTERALWEIARRLAEAEETPATKLAVRATSGVTLCLRGRWRDAINTLDPLVSMITNRRAAQQSAVLFTLYSLYFLGELNELTRRYTRLVAEAEEHGNIFMSASLRAISAVPVWLAADDPARARRELAQAAQWAEGKFSNEWRVTIFGTELDLYVGDGAAAYERVKGLRGAVNRNFFLFVHYVRALTAFAQGRAAIRVAGRPAGRPSPRSPSRGEVRAAAARAREDAVDGRSRRDPPCGLRPRRGRSRRRCFGAARGHRAGRGRGDGNSRRRRPPPARIAARRRRRRGPRPGSGARHDGTRRPQRRPVRGDARAWAMGGGLARVTARRSWEGARRRKFHEWLRPHPRAADSKDAPQRRPHRGCSRDGGLHHDHRRAALRADDESG